MTEGEFQMAKARDAELLSKHPDISKWLPTARHRHLLIREVERLRARLADNQAREEIGQ